MADDYKVQIGINVSNEDKLTSVEQKLNSLPKIKPITLSINTRTINGQLTSIERRLRSLSNYQINIGVNGNGGSGGGNNRSGRGGQSDIVRNAYSDAMYYQRKINSINAQIAKTNNGADNVDVFGLATLNDQLGQYQTLLNNALNYQNDFTKRQRQLFQRLQTEGQRGATLSSERAIDKLSSNATAELERQASQAQKIQQLLNNGTIDNKINSLVSKRDKIGKSTGDIDDALGTDKISGSVQRLRDSLNDAFSGESAFSEAGLQNIINLFEQLNNELTLTGNNLKQLQRENPIQAKSLNESVANGITKKLSTGDLDNVVSTLQSQFAKLGSSDTGITANIEHLKQLLSDMGNASGVDELISKYKEFNTLASKTKEQIRGIKDYQNLEFSRKNLSNDIDAWLKRNSAAAKDFGAELKRIQSEIVNADGAKLTKLKQEFISVKKEAAAAGKTGLSFADQVKKLLPVVSAIQVVQRGVEVVKKMATEVVTVDTAMTELKRVTSLSASEYENLYDSMTQSAKKYGAELDTMINSTASWVRLGFDANTANKLAEISTMYQHVTDLDEGTAVKNLVTAYQGYKDQLLATTNNDQVAAIEKVADIFDKLGNELPVTAAQVGAGMNKWASVAQSAGATIEEAAAMTVGGGSVTQDFEQTGSALKIATLRIQGMKGELEALGEEVDDNVVSVSKMQTQILNLTHGKVNIFEDDGKSFRNIFEIFRDIANILPKLDDTDRSKLLETIAGKNRSNSILAMLQNWEEVERALTAANDASGTAREENDIYMDSIQGKIDSLKASWQALSNTVVDSNILKSGLDFVNGIVDGLDAVVGKIGPIMTIIAGGTAIKSVKSIS